MTTTSRSTTCGMSAARLQLARERIHEQVESGRSPSIAAVVSRWGEIVLDESVGVQGPGLGPLTTDHLWPVASAGKPHVAAALMTLVEQGRIGLCERVVDHYPEIAEGGPAELDVLVHHLLTHTTGWESPQMTGRRGSVVISGEVGPVPAGTDPLWHLDHYLARHPVRIAPVGAQMMYATVHYAVLSEIIRRITGGTLHAALAERVWGPLGMHDTELIVPEERFPQLVTRPPELPFGSTKSPGRLNLHNAIHRSTDDGSSGIHASPHDIRRFGEMILRAGEGPEGRVLSTAAVRAMTRNQVPGVPALFGERLVKEASWGYGFSVICEERWPYFSGGLVPPGAVTHPGAGGVCFWIDFEHELVGVYFEVITEMSEPMLEPISSIACRFQDMITAAIVD